MTTIMYHIIIIKLYAELVSKVSIKKTELLKRLTKRKSQLHNIQIKQF